MKGNNPLGEQFKLHVQLFRTLYFGRTAVLVLLVLVIGVIVSTSHGHTRGKEY